MISEVRKTASRSSNSDGPDSRDDVHMGIDGSEGDSASMNMSSRRRLDLALIALGHTVPRDVQMHAEQSELQPFARGFDAV